MTGRILTVILVTVLVTPSVSIGRDFEVPPEPDVPVRVAVGEACSWSARSLVVLTDGGDRLSFDIEGVSEVPTPLASRLRVRVEYVEVNGVLVALNVLLAESVVTS